jgi:hypothetical protein
MTGRVTFAFLPVLPYHDVASLLLSFRFHWVAVAAIRNFPCEVWRNANAR